MTRCPRCGRPAELVQGFDFGMAQPEGVQLVACTCVPKGQLVVVPNGWRARVARRLAAAIAEASRLVGQ